MSRPLVLTCFCLGLTAVINAAMARWTPLAGVIPGCTAAHLSLALALAICVHTDHRTRKIRNWVTYPSALWLLLLAAVADASRQQASFLTHQSFPEALLGAAACFAVMCVVYLHGGCGAGDVKLALALGAALGWQGGINVLLWCHASAALCLGVLCGWRIGTYLVTSGAWRLAAFGMPVLLWQPAAAAVRRECQRPMPMAVFFAVGYVLTLMGWEVL